VSAPSVAIVLRLESRPVVVVDVASDGEAWRLHDWFETHPRLLELVEAAYAERERAA
jgi:hypothetical protein